MSKQADRYYSVEPWRVQERGFDPAHSEQAESIFSLGNEFMGLRGYFEEGYSGARLQGSYVGGVYERVMLPRAQYRGMPPFIELMVNSVDWVWMPIACCGTALDLAVCVFGGFARTLDLRTGVLTRSFEWQVNADTRVRIAFERFLSMTHPNVGGQRVCVTALRGDVSLTLAPGLDFTQPHHSIGKCAWVCGEGRAWPNACAVRGVTETSGQTLCAFSMFDGLDGGTPVTSPGKTSVRYDVCLNEGDTITLDRLAMVLARRDFDSDESFETASENALPNLRAMRYDALKAESAAWWAERWSASDVEIEGDPENQQGIRYGIFQMHQTLHTADRSAVLGAKGLTGEAYSGNAFWDSEVYCLPFYLLSNPAAARNILQFRVDTLPEAKERAKALDLTGAFYPIATISGHECCNLWQHSSLQLQASTGVAYGLWHYTRVTGDEKFLYDQSADVLVEISRMLASRGAYSPATGEYGFYCVMGPDEFQMMVNHNTYTNYMAKRAFEFTLSVLDTLKTRDAAAYAALAERTSLAEDEPEDWRRKAEHMRVLQDASTGLFEQHDGYFDLPHVDVSEIPIDQFPLYDHWAYDRLYRNDMIKQPDVLMFMLLYSSSFTDRQLAVNYDYYEPRCIHESSLSPSVHSILAARLGRMDKACELFDFATRLDLDDYNRNTREGLHLTAIAASWMNIVYGFGGVRTDGETLSLDPVLPDAWQRFAFRLQYKGATLSLEVTKDAVRLTSDREDAPVVLLRGVPTKATPDGVVIPFER